MYEVYEVVKGRGNQDLAFNWPSQFDWSVQYYPWIILRGSWRPRVMVCRRGYLCTFPMLGYPQTRPHKVLVYAEGTCLIT